MEPKKPKPPFSYVVVPAPWYYGGNTRIFSAHRTLAAAMGACGVGQVVREAMGFRKGDQWLRVDEEVYPVVFHGPR